MHMPCTSLFIPIGRCTTGLSGLGSAYVLMSPCSQLCGADNNIEATIVHHVMITTKPLPFHRVSLVEKRRFNKGNNWVCVYAWDTATHCCRRCFCMSTLDARVEKVSGTAQQRVKSFPANRENATTLRKTTPTTKSCRMQIETTKNVYAIQQTYTSELKHVWTHSLWNRYLERGSLQLRR